MISEIRFGLAAAQGHRAAEYALGGIYEEGEGGLPRDKRKATELYLASARQGFDKAELVVGVGYLVGDGLPNDRRQSIFWLQKSAAQGAQLAHDLLIILSDHTAPQQFANMDVLLSYLNKFRFAGVYRGPQYSQANARASPRSRLGFAGVSDEPPPRPPPLPVLSKRPNCTKPIRSISARPQAAHQAGLAFET